MRDITQIALTAGEDYLSVFYFQRYLSFSSLVHDPPIAETSTVTFVILLLAKTMCFNASPFRKNVDYSLTIKSNHAQQPA